MSYHQIAAVGRATKDPELRMFPDGERQVCNFTLAIDDGFGENKKTIWMRVACWNKTAEIADKYVKRGQQVMVVGRLTHEEGNPRMWGEDPPRSSFEMTADRLILLDNRGGGESNGHKDEDPAEIPF